MKSPPRTTWILGSPPIDAGVVSRDPRRKTSKEVRELVHEIINGESSERASADAWRHRVTGRVGRFEAMVAGKGQTEALPVAAGFVIG
jgi:hypothetical protein